MHSKNTGRCGKVIEVALHLKGLCAWEVLTGHSFSHTDDLCKIRNKLKKKKNESLKIIRICHCNTTCLHFWLWASWLTLCFREMLFSFSWNWQFFLFQKRWNWTQSFTLTLKNTIQLRGGSIIDTDCSVEKHELGPHHLLVCSRKT